MAARATSRRARRSSGVSYSRCSFNARQRSARWSTGKNFSQMTRSISRSSGNFSAGTALSFSSVWCDSFSSGRICSMLSNHWSLEGASKVTSSRQWMISSSFVLYPWEATPHSSSSLVTRMAMPGSAAFGMARHFTTFCTTTKPASSPISDLMSSPSAPRPWPGFRSWLFFTTPLPLPLVGTGPGGFPLPRPLGLGLSMISRSPMAEIATCSFSKLYCWSDRFRTLTGAKHTLHTRTAFVCPCHGTISRSFEQLSQTTRPQCRQWCLDLPSPVADVLRSKLAKHSAQKPQSTEGCQLTGCTASTVRSHKWLARPLTSGPCTSLTLLSQACSTPSESANFPGGVMLCVCSTCLA
mmetsp:Transcript_31962/g.76171  ORF Transcript_31962/g.76171 Transcript_31962/m.76171 type:complete len:353 (+) Transcript_31962:966-2024(+)